MITAEDRKMRLPLWGYFVIFVASFSLHALFDHYGKLSLARPTVYSSVIILFAVAMRWKLKGHLWFWITMALLAALHVPLILFVPWTTKWVPVLIFIPIGAADLYVMLWVISVVAKAKGAPIGAARKHRRSKAVN